MELGLLYGDAAVAWVGDFGEVLGCREGHGFAVDGGAEFLGIGEEFEAVFNPIAGAS